MIAANSLKLARQKGVEQQLYDFRCDGYFDSVVFVHLNISQPINTEIFKNIFVYELPKIRAYGPLFIFIYLYKIFKIVKRHDVNSIRSTEPFYRGLFGLFVAKILNIPFCVSVHSDYEKRFRLDGQRGMPLILNSFHLTNFIQKLVYISADLVLPVRDSLKTKICALGIDKEKIMTIPHGLNLKILDTNQKSKKELLNRYKIEESAKIIVFGGRLSRENYVYDLIELAKLLKQHVLQNWCMLLAGDGPEKIELLKQIKANNLSENVKVLGYLDGTTLFNLRKKCDVNLSLMGGFSLIEACLSGRPTIAYDVEWHFELIENGQSGFLVEEGNISHLKGVIVRLFNEPILAKKIGGKGKSIAKKKHSLVNANQAKILAYQKLYENDKGN